MKSLFITATLVGSLLVSTSHVSAASPPDIGMPDQSALDVLSPTNATWANMTGGVAARPYVTALSVINGGVSTPLITNGTTTAETNVPMGRVAVAISPSNLCRTGQTPSPGVCYATPNRIGLTVGFQIQPGQLGYDFSRANNLTTPVTADTEFDITLNMNTLGRTLRWSWASGVPTYWNTANLGTDAATVHIRIRPTLTPVVLQGTQQLGCSQVPVVACSYTQNTHETLSASMTLSLDNTLDEVFTGALFSSTRSYMGSLMVQPGETPQMTYGVSAPQTWSDGTPNSASLSAVLTDASLLNFYGATPDVVASAEFQTGALNLARTDGGTQGAITWTRWTAGVQGVDGWLITIPDIRFVSAVSSSGVSSFGSAVAPATFKVKAKTSPKVSMARVGSRALITLRVTAAACAKSQCRIVISSISSKVSATATKVGAIAVSRKSKAVSGTVSAKSAKGQRLSAMLQSKKAGQWVYVSSAVTHS